MTRSRRPTCRTILHLRFFFVAVLRGCKTSPRTHSSQIVFLAFLMSYNERALSVYKEQKFALITRLCTPDILMITFHVPYRMYYFCWFFFLSLFFFLFFLALWIQLLSIKISLDENWRNSAHFVNSKTWRYAKFYNRNVQIRLGNRLEVHFRFNTNTNLVRTFNHNIQVSIQNENQNLL